MIPTPELQQEIAMLRAKVQSNSITREELKRAVQLMQQARGVSAAAAAAKPKSTRSISAEQTQDMLKELDGL